MADRLRRLVPRSVRARAAVAAGLASAALFLTGAVWMRHVVYTERMHLSELATERLANRINGFYAGPPFPVFEAGGTVTVDGAVNALLLKPVESLNLIEINDYENVGFSAITADEVFLYEVVSWDGRVLASSPRLRRYERTGPILPAPPRSIWRSAEIERRSVTVGGKRYRVIVTEVDVILPDQVPSYDLNRIWERPVVAKLYLFVPSVDAENAVAGVDRVLLPGLPVAVLLVALVAWLATDRALRPVERMRAQAAEITATDPDRRLQVPGSRDHLAKLAVTFNDTLDRLAAANVRQRRFVGDAAHELRSPIGSMRAILDVALADPGGPDRAAVRDAAAEARRLHRLTDDLLLLARLDADAPATRELVDLAALVRAQLEDRGRVGPIRFRLDAGAGGLVCGDPGQLGRLLANLLDNAERHATALVTTVLDTDPTGEVRLEVVDDGPGVPEDDRERIFERFTRLDESRSRAAGGTGLGLAIARDVCVRHGGTLVAEAAAAGPDGGGGGGARFVVRLPAAGHPVAPGGPPP